MIDKRKCEYWLLAGFKLARLEFIWGVQFEEVQKAFEPSKREICSMLQGESIAIDETDYRTFCDSIMYYFMRNDMEVFSLLLIGNSIQRAGLINVEKGKQRQKMRELARSSLDSIPSEIIKDKDMFFSVIFLNRNKDLNEIFSTVIDALQSEETSVAVSTAVSNNKKDNGYIFISYSSKEKETARLIREMLEKAGISSWMAPESIPTGAEYTEAIVDAIEGSAGVLLVLSDNSQNSQWVPKELDIAISSEKIIFPIHIDESSIIKKIHFRLTDSQVIEAYGRLDQALEKLIWDIKKVM